MKEIEIPLLTDEQIINELTEIQPADFSWDYPNKTELIKFRSIAEAQRDLDVTNLKKAGYEEKK